MRRAGVFLLKPPYPLAKRFPYSNQGKGPRGDSASFNNWRKDDEVNKACEVRSGPSSRRFTALLIACHLEEREALPCWRGSQQAPPGDEASACPQEPGEIAPLGFWPSRPRGRPPCWEPLPVPSRGLQGLSLPLRAWDEWGDTAPLKPSPPHAARSSRPRFPARSLRSAARCRPLRGKAARPCCLPGARIAPPEGSRLQPLEPRFRAPSGHRARAQLPRLGAFTPCTACSQQGVKGGDDPPPGPEEGGGRGGRVLSTLPVGPRGSPASLCPVPLFRVPEPPAHPLVNCPPRTRFPRKSAASTLCYFGISASPCSCGQHRGNYSHDLVDSTEAITAVVFVFPFWIHTSWMA